MCSSNSVLDTQLIAQNTALDVAYLKSAVNTKMEEEELISIRRWLHPDGIDSEASLTAALNLRHPDTGEWLLTSGDFELWLESRNGCLWLYGIRKSSQNLSHFIC